MGCVYCGEGKPTREHVWSQNILRLFEPEANITFDEQRGVAHNADPVLKDVCAPCNRGSSPADKLAGEFVAKYLKTEVKDGAVLTSDKNLLRLWAAKTAANQERGTGKGTGWWKSHTMALSGKSPLADSVRVYFAAWRDLNLMNQFGTIHALMARTAMFVKSERAPLAEIKSLFNGAWALKVGFGVFLVLDVKADATDRAGEILADLTSWGWLELDDTMRVTRSPFGEWSSHFFNMLGPPDVAHTDILQGLRELSPDA